MAILGPKQLKWSMMKNRDDNELFYFNNGNDLKMSKLFGLNVENVVFKTNQKNKTNQLNIYFHCQTNKM